MHQPVDLSPVPKPQTQCPCCKGLKVAHFPGQGIWKCWICNGVGTVDEAQRKRNPRWWT